MTEAVGFSCVLQNPANFFVAALYDLSNIGVVLESQQIPKGSGYPTPPATFSVTFLTALQQNKLYRVILWESADATPTGISRASGDTKASLNSITMRGSLFLTGGGTAGMNVGAGGYVDPANSLAGWTYDLGRVWITAPDHSEGCRRRKDRMESLGKHCRGCGGRVSI